MTWRRQGVNLRSTPPRQILPHPCRGRMWGPKTENVPKISSLRRFYQILASCLVTYLNLGRFASWVLELWRFKLLGVCVTPNFQCPLAAKLCVECESVLRCKNGTDLLITMPSLVGLGHRTPPGARMFDAFCLFVHHAFE